MRMSRRCSTFYRTGRRDGDFEAGIGLALERLLAGPEFLFRIERTPGNVAPRTAYRISDLELASQLSFFLWSSIPDDVLLDLAERGRLKDPAVFEQQVRRMLADARADSLVTSFAAQWLHLRNVDSASPDLEQFPYFDENLRDGVPEGDGALLRKHPARGSQRPRSAERRLHVRQRTAGAPLRDSGHLRQPLPARPASRTATAPGCWATGAS